MNCFGRWYRMVGVLICLFLTGEAPLKVWAEPHLSNSTGRHILWKVESTENTIYLLGSIHVLQEKNYPLAPTIYNAFNQCGTVMFEVDLDGLSSPMSQLQLLAKGFYASGESLKTVLSPERYQTVKSLLAERGHDIENFHRMKPWMAATAVTGLELKKLGFDPEYGVDRHIFAKAREADVEIVGLETVEYQLGLFENLPLELQEFFLLQSLQDLKNIESRIKEMVEAWEQGQVKDLEVHLEGMREYPGLYQALVVSRNMKWLPQIEKTLHQREPAFIVVGTLHLLGEDGILAVLQKKGYHVEQM